MKSIAHALSKRSLNHLIIAKEKSLGRPLSNVRHSFGVLSIIISLLSWSCSNHQGVVASDGRNSNMDNRPIAGDDTVTSGTINDTDSFIDDMTQINDQGPEEAGSTDVISMPSGGAFETVNNAGSDTLVGEAGMTSGTEAGAMSTDEQSSGTAHTEMEIEMTTDDAVIECESRPDINLSGMPNGYQVCEDGRTYKVAPALCTVPPLNGTSCVTNELSGCMNDDDCSSSPHGRCVEEEDQGLNGEIYCGCRYFCEKDEDCADGQVCDCVGGTVGMCRMANCLTQNDCDSRLCEYSTFDDGCDIYQGTFCRSDEDTCSTDASCTSGQCSVSPHRLAEYWSCHEVTIDACF